MERDSSQGDGARASQPEQIVQLALSPAPHNNQQLFSDHYLNVILPARFDWQMLATETTFVFHDL